jgi:hypothetical protein
MLSGNRSGISANVAVVNFLQLENPAPLPETEIKRSWDLETIGITAHQDKEWNTKDSNILQAFHDSSRTESFRRVVSVSKENITLPTNRQNANRSRSLETKLKKNAKLRYVYYTDMRTTFKGDKLRSSIQTRQEGTSYLPHNPKANEEKQTGESCLMHSRIRGAHPP